jgi:hypothetical protein
MYGLQSWREWNLFAAKRKPLAKKKAGPNCRRKQLGPNALLINQEIYLQAAGWKNRGENHPAVNSDPPFV